MKWFCSSALCFNNFTSKDKNGAPLKYYRLPRDEMLQREYCKVFNTRGMNWEKGHICCAHWSSNERKNTSDLPDVPVPTDQFEKLQIKYKTAENILKKASKSTSAMKTRFKISKRKYEIAVKLIAKSNNRKGRKAIIKHLRPEKESLSSKLKKQIDPSNTSDDVKLQLTKMEKELVELRKQNYKLKLTNIKLTEELNKCHAKEYNFFSLAKRPKDFRYLCGLTVEQFTTVFDCVAPYTHLIPYPDCSVDVQNRTRSIDKKTELLAVLTLCRHGLHQGIMSYILDTSKTTMQHCLTDLICRCHQLINKKKCQKVSLTLFRMGIFELFWDGGGGAFFNFSGMGGGLF